MATTVAAVFAMTAPIAGELKAYGVLKARLVETSRPTGAAPHYQIRAVAAGDHYRIAFNTRSQLAPTELRVAIIERFQHRITSELRMLREGRTPVSSDSRKGLDYIRGGLFHIRETRFLGVSEISEQFDHALHEAMNDSGSWLYAFGEFWGPEPARDKFFGFTPGRGVHDLHLNQGNRPPFNTDDGIYQDGGLLIEIPSQNKWWAIFAMYQTQSLTTNNATGRAPEYSTLPGAEQESRPPRGNQSTAPDPASLDPATKRSGSPPDGIETNVVIVVIAAAGVTTLGWLVVWRLARSRAKPAIGVGVAPSANPGPGDTGLSVFISYRREDAAHARLIRDRIRVDDELRNARVFLDLEDLRPGERYQADLRRSIAASDAVIVVIGRAWIRRINELQEEKDVLRFELAHALRSQVPIIPVAVDGMTLPEELALPSDIAALAELHQLIIPDAYFDVGMKKLLDVLRAIKPAQRGSLASQPPR
jgi:uncharacterized protein YukJ